MSSPYLSVAPPPRGAENERALQAYEYALHLEVEALAHEYEHVAIPTRRWLEAADAWEVFADAAEEAGLSDVQEQAHEKAEEIRDRIRRTYAPVESVENIQRQTNEFVGGLPIVRAWPKSPWLDAVRSPWRMP